MWLPSSQVPDHRTAPGVSENFGTMPGPTYCAELGVDVLDEHLARLELGVLEDVRDAVDRPARDPRLVEGAVDLARVVLRGPLADDRVDRLLVLATRKVGREARVVRQLGPAHRVAEAPEDGVLVRGDDDPHVVAGLEDVRRSDALQPGAGRLADDAEPVVLRNGALEKGERRLHQRDVDDLTAAVAAERVAVVERRQDPLHREHRGERVAQRDPGAWRRLARESVDVSETAHRLGDRGEPRPLRVRPGLAVPGDACEDDARVCGREPLVAEVPPLERAGAEVLRHDVRRPRTSSSRSSWPRCSRRLSVMHFLLRDCTGHHNDRPSYRAWPHSRSGSG